jgi:hypothetical protein
MAISEAPTKAAMARCREDVVEDESMDESKKYFAVLL